MSEFVPVLHCVLDRPDRFRILPYKCYAPTVGRKAVVAVDFSEQGGKLLGIKPNILRDRFLLSEIHGSMPEARFLSSIRVL